MRLLYQLQLVAFLAAFAQAAATPRRDELEARYRDEVLARADALPAPKKRLLGICIFGFSLLGDCDRPSTTFITALPESEPTTSVTPAAGASSAVTATGTVAASSGAAGNATTPTDNAMDGAYGSPSPTPAPEPTEPVTGIEIEGSAPGTAGLNSTVTLAPNNPYTWVYPQPDLPSRKVQTPDSVFKPTGGGLFPSPQTRRFNFVIDKAHGSPDGFHRQMYVINGQFPAPLIEANQGDTLEITVKNNLDIRQAIHWHGMRQKNTQWADGVPGIHQCPIPPGGTFTYKFKLDVEMGTYWYHSHYGNTMGDGISGGLIVHSRNEPIRKYRGYDDDRIVYLSDWNDNQSEIILHALHNMTQMFRGSPFMGPPDGLLINGVGQTDCSRAQVGVQCTSTKMAEVKGVYGRKYRFRLINHGSESLIRYSIDQHVMTVIELDDTPVEPTDMHEVMLWPGQRVSVVVTLNKGFVGSSYYMRARMGQPCFGTTEARETKAKLQYTDWLGLSWFAQNPRDQPWGDLKNSATELCHDMDEYQTFRPSVHEPSPAPQGVSVFNSAAGVFRDFTGAPFIGFGMNDVTYTNYINNPLLKQVYKGAELDPSHVASHTWPNEGSYDLILNQHDPDPLAHPFHLHGRPFQILARGKGSITAADLDSIALNTENPLRRDVLSIPGSSYAVIRLPTDDPGVWPLHCHIGWHVGVGKLGVLVVRPDAIRSGMTPPPAWDGLCAGTNPNDIDYVRRDLDFSTRNDEAIAHEIAKRSQYFVGGGANQTSW